MPYTINLKNNPPILTLSDISLAVASYQISAARSYSPKYTVSGSCLVSHQGVEPTVITFKGRFLNSAPSPIPQLDTFVRNKVSFTFFFDSMQFQSLNLIQYSTIKSASDHTIDCELKFITTKPISEVS